MTGRADANALVRGSPATVTPRMYVWGMAVAVAVSVAERASETGTVGELAGAIDALAALGDIDPDALSDAEIADAIVGLAGIESRLEGVCARLVARFDAREVWADDRARSAASWLAAVCGWPREKAASRVRFARALRSMPATEEALLAGRVGIDQAKRLSRAQRRAPEVFARDETTLLEQAKSLRFEGFARVVAYWEQRADPDGAEKDSEALRDGRRLHLSQTFGGAWALDGIGDPIGGSVVAEVLARIEDELFEADWAAAKEALGEKVTPADLPRTPAQRRFDALVEMATRAASAPRDATRPRPLFSVFVDYPTLAGRVLELANGTVVSPGALVPWLSEADLERIVFDADSRVIDVSVRQRLFRGATRRAVEVRDRTCTGFACDVPAERCDVDHIQPYTEGGLTIQDNGRLLCPTHHPGRRKDPRARRRDGPDPPAP